MKAYEYLKYFDGDRSNDMEQLFRILSEDLAGGEDAVLVTIIASSGSTPNGIGARMLMDKTGRRRGTIGGGAVEYRAEGLALEALKEGRSYTKAFTLRRNEIEDLGMICGGDVNVYFQFMRAGKAGADFAARAAACFERDENAWLLTDITDDGAWTMALYTEGGGLDVYVGEGEDTLSALPEDELRALLMAGPVRRQVGTHVVYSEPLVQAGRAVVFGGGHVAQELVPVLAHLGWRCVVVDDRPEFVRPELFPAAQGLVLADFENIAAAITLSENDYIFVMTRGHAGDYTVQRQVLQQKAAYVGVIGSRSKTAAVSAKLLADGIPQEMIDTVHTPIGLPIKAKSPAEIAVSIAAEVIQLRAQQAQAAG